MVMKFISCASYYGTGSSAITDLISEYSTVYSFTNEEFRFLQDPDGIDDLAFHLVENHNRHNAGHSLKRFKKLVDFYSGGWYGKKYETYFHGNWKKCSYDYIESLTDFKFNGWWFYDLYDRGMLFYFQKRILDKLLHKTIWKNNPERTLNTMKNEKTYCSLPSENEFVYKTKEYIENLFSSVCPKDKYVMVDQIVPPSNLWRYTRYFDDIKVVVVDRDPRDLWILEKYYWKDGVIPYDNVNVFCEWFKYTRNHRNQEAYDENVIKLLQFEDLIYKYEEIKSLLESWIGLSCADHINKKKIFIPEKSINNTHLWTKNNNINIKEISIIEKELSKYLYSY